MASSPFQDRFRNRVIAVVQLLTSPLVLAIFVIAEPTLIPEWAGYVGHCGLCIMDGKRR